MLLPTSRANCFPPHSGICGLTLEDAPWETANLLDQQISTFLCPLLQSLMLWWWPTIELFLLLLHESDFITLINHTVNILTPMKWSFDPQKGHDKQVENYCPRWFLIQPSWQSRLTVANANTMPFYLRDVCSYFCMKVEIWVRWR